MSYTTDKKDPIRITAEHKYIGDTGIEVWFELQKMEDGFFHPVLCTRNYKHATHKNICFVLVGVRPNAAGSNDYVRIHEGMMGYEYKIRNLLFREKGWVFFVELVKELYFDGNEMFLWNCCRSEWFFKNMVL